MKADFTMIVKGLPGAEGPVFDTIGHFFMVVPWEGRIVRVTEDGKVSDLANTGGIPAGLQCDKEDNLWVADMKLGIFKVTPAGELEHVVANYQGAPIRGCNDCAFDSQGNLYVTAPAGSGPDQPVGELFCLTRAGEIIRLDGGFRFSNGIAVSEDDRTLIVAETYAKALWAYDIQRPGVVANKRILGRTPGDHQGGPDGIDFDRAGNLLVADYGGGAIRVFNHAGELLESIETPFEKVTNVHFGGEDGRWVYVTENTYDGLWKFHWRYAGQAQYCAR